MKGWAAIARLGGLGDNLVAASVTRPLKQLGYNVEVITSDRASAIFLNNPFVDKLTIKRDGDLPTGPDWQRWFVERAKEYDVFGHLSHSMEVRHALFPDSTPFWYNEQYRRKLCAGSYLETAHDIAGVPHIFGPLYFPTDEEMANARISTEKTGGRYIAWVLSGSRVDKIWPYTASAIPRIIKECGVHVVLLGIGDRQKEMADAVLRDVKMANSDRDMLHIGVVNVSMDEMTRWGLRASLAIAMGADLVVSPDTGTAWAVAMEQMPKIMLLSHASAENITKHWVNTTTLHADPDRVSCWPCHRLHNDISTCRKAEEGEAAACMADISTERMVQAVKQALKRGNVVPLREAVA